METGKPLDSALTCLVHPLHLQNFDAHQSIQQPLHPIHAGAELLGHKPGTEGLPGPQQEVKHSQFTGRKDHLRLHTWRVKLTAY